MRVSIISLVALIASASAYDLVSRQSLPNCAASCLASAKTGSCNPKDNKCLCNDQQFINSTGTCIAGSCHGSDLVNAQKAATQLCLAAGVTLLPSAASSSVVPTPTSPSTSSPTPASSNSTKPASSDARSNSINALAGVAAVALVGLNVF